MPPHIKSEVTERYTSAIVFKLVSGHQQGSLNGLEEVPCKRRSVVQCVSVVGVSDPCFNKVTCTGFYSQNGIEESAKLSENELISNMKVMKIPGKTSVVWYQS